MEGKKVSLLGFGSFEPRDRSARQGLNPKTGEKIAIPAKRVPTFSAGKLFKDRVQGKSFKSISSFNKKVLFKGIFFYRNNMQLAQ